MTIWAIHGFLGQTSDFDRVQSLCQSQNKNLNWKSLEYLHLRELSPQNSLQMWGENLNQYIKRHSSPDQENIILGYSQGGRLALHALKNNPQLWKAAIVISANPGIKAWEKPTRLQNDEAWAESFLHDKFDKVVERWNSATVFEGSKVEPVRHEKDFNRRQLADCLINWSIAKQEDFSSYLESFQGNLYYVCGEKDLKYCKIGKDLESKNKKTQLIEIPGSGHRVIFDKPEALSDVIVKIAKS